METKPVPGPRTFTTHRIANNAAATIANINCLEKKVRTPMERDESFALVTIIRSVAGCYCVGLVSLSMLGGT
jgi:hypothetical protein